MQKTLFTIFVLGFLTFMCALSQASITDVDILPAEPTVVDPISILVSGEENFNISISDSFFTIDGALLELDIHFQEGMMPTVTPWSHTESVGILPVGTYDLTVNTWIATSPAFNDTYHTSFEVVPEPATILLFGLGMVCVRKMKIAN